MTHDAPNTPPAEVDITPALIRRLLSSQHPDLADLDIRIMEAGWDNVMVRLGDDLALRLPRRAAAQPLIRNEQTWLSRLAPQLPLPISAPQRIGIPEADYPFHWSIQKWLPGRAADLAPPDSGQALVFANFLKALHALPVPQDPPANPVRNCALSVKQPDTERRMDILTKTTHFITPALRGAWERALKTPIDGSKCLIVGDIHPRNVLTHKGKLLAIIDWGDMCVGDPATDLMGTWGLFEDQKARRDVFESYGASQKTRVRAMGWAIFSGVILAQTGRVDTPRHAVMGDAILRRINADAQST